MPEVIIKNVGRGMIILCFCPRCKGTSPLVVADKENIDMKRLCPTARKKMIKEDNNKESDKTC